MTEENKEKKQSSQVEDKETAKNNETEKKKTTQDSSGDEGKKAVQKEPGGKFKELIKQIEELSVKDLAELVKELEDRFGVSAVAPAPAAAATAAGGEEKKEEKSSYSVVLADAGAQKIAVIKAIREIRPDLGLKEAKDLADNAPKEVKANVPSEEAKEAQKKLEEAGAKVELK